MSMHRIKKKILQIFSNNVDAENKLHASQMLLGMWFWGKMFQPPVEDQRDSYS